MRVIKSFVLVIFFAFISSNIGANTNINSLESYYQRQGITFPIAKIDIVKLEKFADVREDPYFWLREKENPLVIDYLNAENEYAQKVMKDAERIQLKLFEEMKNRLPKKQQSVAYQSGEYLYYQRYERGDEYPRYYRHKVNAEEELIVDVNKLVAANGGVSVNVSSLVANDKGNIVAYAVDKTGGKVYDIYFKNMRDGTIYKDQIANTNGEIAWSAGDRDGGDGRDEKTFYFITKEEGTQRENKLYKHTLGNDQSPELIYEEKDEKYNLYLESSISGRFIFLISSSTNANEYQYIERANPHARWKIFQKRMDGLLYYPTYADNRFFIQSQDENNNSTIYTTSIENTSMENWQEYQSFKKNDKSNVFVEDLIGVKNYLAMKIRENGFSKIIIKNFKDGKTNDINFAEQAYSLYFDKRASNYEKNILGYNYTSPVTPETIVEYNIENAQKRVLWEKVVLGGFKKENYESKSFLVPSRDGKMIPLSLVYRKNHKNLFKKDGSNPLVLNGYGAYGVNCDPNFYPETISLLDRGFIYAYAHVRGGSELGIDWYEQGKLKNKMNTFYDFIDVAEYLVKNGWTTRKLLVAEGWSAGGLLMGAVSNLSLNLFKGIIAHVPFVDVVTSMLDESIPLVTSEYEEWGDPRQEDFYRYMLRYSPYDNVEKKNYPHMLITAGLNDSQVQYWEPAKWTAKLRSKKTNGNLLLLKTNMGAGHHGEVGRLSSLRDRAFEFAFIFKILRLSL
ncbi:MAG: S9 family peptidase [Oligoflexia bacterium]|nr:S9 family peptidase [Oligoflexia bacterium]